MDRRWLALAALAVAQFMVFLDETVVNVALPSIKADLGFSQATLSWVVSAYIVVFGGLVLLGGRVADLFGRRRVFLIGTAVFGGASLLDGLASSQGMLLGARVLQGVGAALATPAALALVTVLFPVRTERVKALAIWGALSGLGFAVGILLGGAITEALSWRWVFLINVPVALVSLFVVPRLVSESRISSRRGFDFAGASAVTIGLSTLVYALVKAPAYGWSSLTTHVLFAGAAGLLAAFVVIERLSATPLLPSGFLAQRRALVPNLLQLLLGVSGISSLFLLTLYTQQVLGYSPLKAGVAYLPLAAAGLGIASVGMTLLGHAPVAADYASQVLPALVILGLGAGLSFVAITTAALAGVEDDTAGLASGLLSTTVQIGGALGVTVLAGVVVTQRASELLASGSAPPAAQAGGLQLAFLIAAGVAQIASVVALVALPRGKAETAVSATAAEASS